MNKAISLENMPLHVNFVSPNIDIYELEKGLSILRSLEIGVSYGSIQGDLNVKFEGKNIVTIYPSSNLKVNYECIKNLEDCKVSEGENCITIIKDFLGDEFTYNFYKNGH